MVRIDTSLTPAALKEKLIRFWELSHQKIRSIEKQYDESKGAPVFTIQGKYSSRGWTEWTQGFQYGSVILQFDATGDEEMLRVGKEKTVERMAPHVSHIGVHDHGFNNISTYGNLHRLMREGKTPHNEWENNFYELALKISGAVQAARWTPVRDGGFIHSFNGPHSLFVDTIRSVRSLMISHRLGHVFQAEGDKRVDLLDRAILHMYATARYSVYYGEGRDVYDVKGRTAHEIIFNTKDGNYRCPNSQQGYTGFSTWTRGLAWAMCGFAEELEWFDHFQKDISRSDLQEVKSVLLRAAQATCDFYIDNTPLDGVPYWDTGAPGLDKMGDYLARPADPYNEHEPVDSSAACIAAQGLLRLGNYLSKTGDETSGRVYKQAGITIANTLFAEPYLSTSPDHQGMILHSVYHRPNGWDYIPAGSKIPNGESSIWGDYHARELALYLLRLADEKPYYTFFNGIV